MGREESLHVIYQPRSLPEGDLSNPQDAAGARHLGIEGSSDVVVLVIVRASLGQARPQPRGHDLGKV